ncbi:HdeD family acid-resistance protein [Aquimarina sediminis]|uniref:HdeD family acid-resistance protein n=1 Tax=Aquimarina sediminis TaxID=2070536 RepID=UPI000CA035B8|nr:HdeD family acid-resistance protein [Aquimarina sediminis]
MKTFFKTVNDSVKYWYLPLIIGLIFIALGIYVLISPLESYVTLSYLFSISFVISGIVEIYFSVSNRNEIDNWGWNLVFGISTLIIGILLFMHPEISITILPFYVGFLLMFRSAMAMGYALDLKHYGVLDWGNLMILGILGFIFSFILIWNPLFAGITILVWTALALIAVGVFNIYVSIKLKKLKNIPSKISKELKDKLAAIKQEIQEELKPETK